MIFDELSSALRYLNDSRVLESPFCGCDSFLVLGRCFILSPNLMFFLLYSSAHKYQSRSYLCVIAPGPGTSRSSRFLIVFVSGPLLTEAITPPPPPPPAACSCQR